MSKRLYVIILAAIVLAVVFVYPFVLLAGNSLINDGKVSLSQYYELLVENYPFMYHFWVSVLYAIAITAVIIVISVPAAHFFAKVEWKGRDAVFFVYIIMMMMPYQVLVVPLYRQFSDYGLGGSPLAVILPACFQPFWVFMLRQYAKSIPDSLIDSMRLETNSVFTYFRYLIIPMLGDCITALAVLSFAECWNMFEPPLIMLTRKELLPIPVVISKLLETDSGLVFSSGVIYMIPAIILFIGTRRKLEKGVEVMKW